MISIVLEKGLYLIAGLELCKYCKAEVFYLTCLMAYNINHTKQGVGVFIWQTLSHWLFIQDCAWLEALRGHAPTNGLQGSGRRGAVSKCMVKRDSR